MPQIRMNCDKMLHVYLNMLLVEMNTEGSLH